MPLQEPRWTPIYEAKSPSDAELVRTTLEVAGYRVLIEESSSAISLVPKLPLGVISVSVPAEDAEDAREFLRSKTSLLPSATDASASQPESNQATGTESVEDAVQEILGLRRQYEVAACKYCGIPTLDVSEADLESHSIAVLRAAGLGVNSATFSDFASGERICTECAGHEVTCDLCGRTLDAFLDEGEYVRARDDEA